MSARLEDLDTLANAECARHWLDKIELEKVLPGIRFYVRAARFFVGLIISFAKQQITKDDLAARHALIGQGGDA
jgi:hypothetical protein